MIPQERDRITRAAIDAGVMAMHGNPLSQEVAYLAGVSAALAWVVNPDAPHPITARVRTIMLANDDANSRVKL